MKHDPISTGMWDLSVLVECPYCEAPSGTQCHRLTTGKEKRHSHEPRMALLVTRYRELQRAGSTNQVSARSEPHRTSLGIVRRSADQWGFGLYDESGRYRYWFRTATEPARRDGYDIERTHADGLPVVTERTLVWVGLSPSRSDDKQGARRVTLEKVLGWAGDEGLDEVLGVNLYAFRHSNARRFARRLSQEGAEPFIGKYNNAVLSHALSGPGFLLAAWGRHCAGFGRGNEIRGLMSSAHCAGLDEAGEPLHPRRRDAVSLVQLPRL